MYHPGFRDGEIFIEGLNLIVEPFECFCVFGNGLKGVKAEVFVAITEFCKCANAAGFIVFLKCPNYFDDYLDPLDD